MEWLYALSLLGSLLTGGFNVWQQRKQNKEVQDFNSEEAEKNRQWQEDMYNKYESPLAQVLQRTQAGLNPSGNVTSQSVGTGSTASSGSSSLPGIPDAFSMLSSQMMQLKSFKLDQSQKKATLDKTKEETNSLILDNQMKALESGNREEWINLQIELLRADVDTKKWSADKLHAEAERAWDIANQSRKFTESGGNEFQDTHDSIMSSIDQAKATIDNLDARTDLTNEQKKGVKLANHLSSKFDEKFMQLDYDARKQQVNEYLLQSDKRQEMFDWSYDLSQRQYLIQSLQDQYDRDIWMAIVDLMKDSNDSDFVGTAKKIAGILSGYIARDPTGALNSISNLVDGISPDITFNENNYSKNIIK